MHENDSVARGKQIHINEHQKRKTGERQVLRRRHMRACREGQAPRPRGHWGSGIGSVCVKWEPEGGNRKTKTKTHLQHDAKRQEMNGGEEQETEKARCPRAAPACEDALAQTSLRTCADPPLASRCMPFPFPPRELFAIICESGRKGGAQRAAFSALSCSFLFVCVSSHRKELTHWKKKRRVHA